MIKELYQKIFGIKPTQEADPVERAKKTAVRVNSREPDQHHQAMAKRFDAQAKATLPMESELRGKLLAERDECLRHKLYRKYAKLDMSFLKWRNKSDGMPTFGVFSPDAEETVMRVRFRTRSFPQSGNSFNLEFEPASPLADMYADIFDELEKTLRKKLSSQLASEAHISLRAKFSGAVPQNIRNLIASEHASHTFERILVIAAVPEWKVDEVVVSAVGDPLVVGFAMNAWWLIASFDTTPIEDVVKAEWATGPQPE